MLYPTTIAKKRLSLAIAGTTLLGFGEAAQAITREVPGSAEIIAPLYLNDPDVTFHSYTSTWFVGSLGCSGNMIGPNILMTAAHCGPGAPNVNFKVYKERDRTQPETEQVRCWEMIQTLPSNSDVSLLYCPNINGLPPGLKYGYMDFDASPPQEGQPLYSIWRNPVTNLSISDAVLYSAGKITVTGDMSFGGRGVYMDIWSALGASGSASIRPDNQRIHIGPQSGGSSDPAGAPLKGAMSMYDYLNTAVLDTINCMPQPCAPQINTQQLTAKGVTNLSQFEGLLDKNHNNVFDIQEAVEKIDGEVRRDHYWLGFESERRNALWGLGNPSQVIVRFQPSDLYVNLDIRAGGLWALRHDRLNLKANTDYRVSVMVHTNATGHSHALSFRLSSGGAVTDSHDIPTNPGTGWEMNTFHLRTGGSNSNNTLLIVSNAAVNASLAAVSLIEEGSLMDFDTHDKRANWRNDSNGARTFILPDGRGASDSPDWAAVVGPTAGVIANGSWPARNRQLAFVQGESYQICFQHRQYRGAVPQRDWGIMQLKSGSTVIAEERFRPLYGAWTRHCTNFFAVPSGDNNLRFGLMNVFGRVIPSYLVDDIEIIRG